MAGIRGGEGSGVSEETKDLFLESAFFAPISLAGKARSYGLHTDSSHRFERGVDAQLQNKAIERATSLIVEIAGGQVAPVTEQVSQDDLPRANEVTLRRAKLDQYLAVTIAKDQVTDILTRLDLDMVEVTDEHWGTRAPSHRFDIAIEADLIEEVARIYGYENIPANMPTAAVNFTPAAEAQTSIQTMRATLVAQGYQEAITYSFIDKESSLKFVPDVEPVPLENPISAEMGVMRPSLIPGLMKAYLHNQNRQQSRVRMFETGRRFIGSVDALEQLDQQERLAGLIAGSREPEAWYHNSDKVDFYDVKSHIEALFALNDGDMPSYERADVVYLHPGRSAKVIIAGEEVGVFGELHPQFAKSLGCNQTVYLFDLNLDAVLTGKLPVYKVISKFPEVRRDFALLADRETPVASLQKIIMEEGGEAFKEVSVFDVYQGQGIDDTKKSVALGLTWQHPSHTLSDEEINKSVEQILAALESQLGVVVRG
jgi:phenylalanyl-tRNA synthetase beta chain